MNLNKHLLLYVLMSLYCDSLFYLDNNPKVITKLGPIKGSIMHTRLGKQFYAFRGVYYAEPPVGNLRFKSPVPKKPWADVMDASKEGPSCPQKNAVLQSENCLTMNIYTKQIEPGGKKLPVILHLHTGGFHERSSQSFLYGPYYLLDEDIVLVLFNYRLGSLGFLNTGDEFAPGNFGLKDQVEALRFIQSHIDSFGGDPNSVTLTGQSAGARSIIFHMISPMSKGLFHRAIAMSGAPTTLIPPQRQQLDLAKKQAKLIGCPTDSKKEMYKCLMEKPAEDYGSTEKKTIPLWHLCPILTWYPAIEKEIPGVERFLSDDPVTLIEKGPVNPVPLILGVTKDEYSFLAKDIIEPAMKGNDSVLQEMNDRWYELAPHCCLYEKNTERSKFISDELSRYYFNNTRISLENNNRLRHLFGTCVGHFPFYRSAELLAKYSSEPVYFYKFDYISKKMKHKWKHLMGEVWHGDDLQFLFTIKDPANPEKYKFPIYNEKDEDFFMLKRLTKWWVHFAKTGEPLPKDSELFDNVTWEALNSRTKKYLNIGRKLKLESDFMSSEMKFWDKLFPLPSMQTTRP